MPKRILTLEDLVAFCKNEKIHRFDAQENGQQICVRVDNIATFEEVSEQNSDGFMHLLFKVCHAGENRNMSNISKNNLEKYKNTINYRPVLASIVTSPDDASVLDFNSHDIEIDDNGNPIYIEKQVGCFTADEPFLKYDEQNDKTYLMAHAVIPEEYTATADIIRRKGGTKVSCEIGIDTMQYNEETGILDIIDFSFLGVCLLGDHVTEGMAGARADIESISDFSAENNSVVNKSNNEFNDTLVETLKKLNETLEKFNDKNDSDKKGGEDQMNKFEELLELYELTADEIEFEVEGLSDEELEAAFNEAFGDAEEFKKKKKKCSEENPDDKDEDFAGCGTKKKKKKCDADDNEEEENDDEDFAGCGTKKKKKKCSEEEENENEEEFAGCGGKKKKKRCSINTEDNTIEFELSHDDIRMALYGLLESDSDEDSYSWVCEVYDTYFIYQKETYSDNGYEYKYYKQSYSKDGDNVSLSGDAVEVFSTFVTESERTALDMMRTQYEELKKFHDDTIAAQEQSQKDEIFNDEKYSILAENEKFAELKKDSAKFSVSEIEEKCKVIFAEEVMAKGNYSASGEHSENKPKKIGFNFNEKPKKAQAYAGLFND